MAARALELVPMSSGTANTFVQHHHRHHRPDEGHKFSIGAEREGQLVGVAIVGRPKGRGLDNGRTLEVTRLCTLDGPIARHAASMLYAAAWRAARALGWKRIVTYTLASEAGTSVRAAGWVVTAKVPGRDWTTPSRPRHRSSPAQTEDKLRWEPAQTPSPIPRRRARWAPP